MSPKRPKDSGRFHPSTASAAASAQRGSATNVSCAGRHRHPKKFVLLLLSLFALLPAVSSSADPALDRDPRDYLALGMISARISSLSIEPPGCNLGVNCSPLVTGRGKCGRFHGNNAS